MYKCWQCLWLTDRKFCWVIFFFFSNMIIYFLKHNVSACHIFFYTDWIDLPIMTFHVHVKYEDIISWCVISSSIHVFIFFSLWCLTFILSVPFLYQRISGWFCKHLAVIYFTRILICIKLTQPEPLFLLLSFVIWIGNQQPRLQKKRLKT